MKTKLFTALASLLLLGILNKPANAQLAGVRCATMESLKSMKVNDPSVELKRQNIDNFVTNYALAHSHNSNRNIITIPIVVHVLYYNERQNISDAQVQSQIDVLNKDYRKINSDTGLVPTVWKNTAADIQIQFCLAQQDGNGNATNGITRRKTNTTNFNADLNDAKHITTGGEDAWDATKYLNLWVVPYIKNNTMANTIFGYAQFPGLSAATDGVVIAFENFGTIGTAKFPFNKGRTATHEIGHWLNLIHIWGDDASGSCTGTDQVNDTPNQADATFGNKTPGTIVVTCSNGPQGNMWMNYMDYTDDACLYMFTNDQAARMLACFASGGPRESILTSNACMPTTLMSNAGLKSIVAPSTNFCATKFLPQVELKNFGMDTLKSATVYYQLDTNAVKSYNWSGTLISAASETVMLDTINTLIGNHSLKVYTSMPNGNSDSYVDNDTLVINFSIITNGVNSLPYTEDFSSTSAFPYSNWKLINGEQNVTWGRIANVNAFGNTTGTGCIKMDNASSAVYISGEHDVLYMPTIDFSTSITPITFKFDLAAARYDAVTQDSLILLVSKDCGSTWNEFYRKGSTELATNNNGGLGANNSGQFTPTGTQWRTETVTNNTVLNTLAGSSDVQFAIVSRTDWGNNVYMDNINIFDGTTAISNVSNTTSVISVYPNPANDLIFVRCKDFVNATLSINIYNGFGQLVKTISNEKSTKEEATVDISGFTNGLYYLEVKSNNQTSVHKLSVIK